jgi:hypothetical protein
MLREWSNARMTGPFFWCTTMSVQRNRGLLSTLISVCGDASIANLESVWNAYPDIQALVAAYMAGVANPMGDTRTESRIERCTYLLVQLAGGVRKVPVAVPTLF